MEIIVDKLKNFKYSIKERQIGLKSKSISGTNSISLNDASGNNAIAFGIKGNSTQEARDGYNLIKYSDTFRNPVSASAEGITPSLTSEGHLKYVVERGNKNYSTSWWDANNNPDDVENAFEDGDTFTIVFTVKKTSESIGIPRIYMKTGDTYHDMTGNITTEFSEIYYTGIWTKNSPINYHLGLEPCVGTFIFKNWMIKKGEYEPYEPYGASPSPEFPSEIENVGGNNLLQNNATSTTINGITFTVNADGTVTANGTATSDINFYINEGFTLPKGIYSLSDSSPNPSSTTYFSYLDPLSLVSKGSFEVRDETTEYKSRIVIRAGQELNNIVFKPMINKGSRPTFYVPYNHIGFKNTGENLFNNNDVIPTSFSSVEKTNSGFVATRTSTATGDLFVASYEKQLKPNTTYTLYMNRINSATCFFYSDALWGTTIPRSIAKSTDDTLIYTFTTYSSGKVVIGFYSANQKQGDTLTLSNIIMLEGEYSSENVPEYAPHQENIVTFPLSEGQKLYKDTYLADDGIHHKRKQVVFDGSEGWFLYANYSDTGGTGYCYQLQNTSFGLGTNTSICSHFKNVNSAYMSNIGYVGSYCDHLTIQRKYFITDKSTVAEFQSYLSEQHSNGTPVILEYELAEEEIIPYTEEQKEAYNKLKNLAMFKGVNDIEVASNIEVSETSIEYYSDEVVSLDNYKFEVKEI